MSKTQFEEELISIWPCVCADGSHTLRLIVQRIGIEEEPLAFFEVCDGWADATGYSWWGRLKRAWRMLRGQQHVLAEVEVNAVTAREIAAAALQAASLLEGRETSTASRGVWITQSTEVRDA